MEIEINFRTTTNHSMNMMELDLIKNPARHAPRTTSDYYNIYYSSFIQVSDLALNDPSKNLGQSRLAEVSTFYVA